MTDKLTIFECMNNYCGYCFPNPAICPKHDGIITINHKCCPRCKCVDIAELDTIEKLISKVEDLQDELDDYGMGDL